MKEEVHSLHLQSKITVKVGNFMLVRDAITTSMKTLSTMTFIVNDTRHNDVHQNDTQHCSKTFDTQHK